MTGTATVQPAPVTAKLKVRESVTEMSADSLERFREAVRALMARRDNRSYQFYAGWHGVPLQLCQHHNPIFLPWHRGYLWHFEVGLQRIDPDVTLPWWDWVRTDGVPDAYARRRTPDRRTNVLFSAAVEPLGTPRRQGWPTRTSRTPGAAGGDGGPAPIGPPIGDQVYQWLLEPRSFDEFNRRITLVHDNLHVWVGGTMRDPDWAGYDPLFWAHHTMVDRVWRIWQHSNPGSMTAFPFLDLAMTYAKAPSFRVRDLLKVSQLGYEYAGMTASTPGTV